MKDTAVKRNAILIGVIVFYMICWVSVGESKAEVILASGEKVGCVIVVESGSSICGHAGKRLQGFIKKCCGEEPAVIEKSSLDGEDAGFVTIVIGRVDSFKGLGRFGLSVELSQIKRDGYILKTAGKGKGTYILALGKTEKGAVNAVWRLIREIRVDKGTVSLSTLDIAESPFLKGREVIIINPWVREGLRVGDMSEKLKQKYCPRNWSEERLRQYVNLLDSFGYNNIEVSDTWLQVSYLSGDAPRTKWRDKIIVMSEQAHKNGQKIALWVYGSSAKDFETGKEFTRPGACFNDPNERQVLLKSYNLQAGNYGRCVDRIHTHWSDWGGAVGCQKGCTIETAVKQHNIILSKFRKKNLAVESDLGLWGIKAGAWSKTEGEIWPGYKGIDTILDSPIFPREVSIAVTAWCGQTDLETILHIADKGFKPCIWSWRLLDIEHWHGMHVHTKKLEKYFRSLPREAGGCLEFHTVDDVSQFLIMSNLYVAGQLMWNPEKSGGQLLREFTRGMFGAGNEEKMASVYEAYEKCCCYLCPLPQDYPLSFVFDGARERLKLLSQAKATIKEVEIADDFIPAFPLIIKQKELLKEIDVQFDLLKPYLEFQIAASELLKMKERGAAKEELSKAFAVLPKPVISDEYLNRNIYGRYWFDLRKLKQLGFN